MDPLQQQLARIALDTIGDRGFVLGGGHAVELHGMTNRLSEDIDLFSAQRGGPGEVGSLVVTAFEHHGHSVTVTRQDADLVQMLVTDSTEQTCKVDLGVFWRAREQLRDEYRSRVTGVRASSLLPKLVDTLFEIPALTIASARRALDVTHRAATVNIERLVEEGLLEEVPKSGKTRRFVARGILDVINGET